MTNQNGTQWVTIKLPQPTRDKASEDSRTYEEIMLDGLGEASEARGVGVDPEVVAECVARELDYERLADELAERARA